MDISLLIYEIGTWTGVISFIALGLLIFSGDTARLWDHFLGIDKIIKNQRRFSIFISIVLISHPLFFMISNKTVFPFLIPNFTIVPLSLGIVAFYLFIAVMIASTFYKRVSYKSWQYIHIVTYVLYFFALYHAIKIGSDADDLMPIYLTVTILIVFGIIYRTNYKLKMWRSGPANVVNVVKETHDSFSLYVHPSRSLDFKAGQFCFLRLDINKLHARHPFTIASTPKDRDLRFTIKLMGRFTNAAGSLLPGNHIYVDGPFGIFTPPIDRDIVCIAGGIGITPFMSIIKDRANKNCNKSVILFYGCKSKDDIIYFDELNNMSYPWLKIVYILNDTSNTNVPCESGFISKDIIKKYVPNIDNFIYYICGPELMKNSIIGILKSLEVPNSRIKKEDFFW